jgi:hypothetical protein
MCLRVVFLSASALRRMEGSILSCRSELASPQALVLCGGLWPVAYRWLLGAKGTRRIGRLSVLRSRKNGHPVKPPEHIFHIHWD